MCSSGQSHAHPTLPKQRRPLYDYCAGPCTKARGCEMCKCTFQQQQMTIKCTRTFQQQQIRRCGAGLMLRLTSAKTTEMARYLTLQLDKVR